MLHGDCIETGATAHVVQSSHYDHASVIFVSSSISIVVVVIK